LFIDPEPAQLDAAASAGAPVVELHTGCFADAKGPEDAAVELRRVHESAVYGAGLGLTIHAGHGLNRGNVQPVAAISQIVELNIGHALIARSVFDGLAHAVADIKRLMVEARQA
jgi:pyridoxine 5-phosphate synthase